MKKSNLSWVAILAAMILGACSEENDLDGVVPDNPDESSSGTDLISVDFKQNYCILDTVTRFAIGGTIHVWNVSSDHMNQWGIDIVYKNGNDTRTSRLSGDKADNLGNLYYTDTVLCQFFTSGKAHIQLRPYVISSSDHADDGDHAGGTISGTDRIYGQTIEAVLQYACPDDHHPHAVDLGLPGGMKWSCCNAGAEQPFDAGGYYAWGETEEKSFYDWGTYSYYNPSMEICNSIGSDITGTGYDVAHTLWGGDWRMPRWKEMEELWNHCTLQWTTSSDHTGYWLSGPNGVSVFIPAAGFRYEDSLYGADEYGYLWSSTPYKDNFEDAYCLSYNSDGGYIFWRSRRSGRNIRPVTK